MNIYEKLQTVRVKLQESGLKKTGHNKHMNLDYFELSDILPHANKLMLENSMTATINFGAEFATLTVFNCEKVEEQIVFTSPMSTANLSSPVQSLGAVQTYLKRYLYMAAFDITDADVLDGRFKNEEPVKKTQTNNKQQDKNKQTPGCINEDQAKEIKALVDGQADIITEVLDAYKYTRLGEIKLDQLESIKSAIKAIKAEREKARSERERIADETPF